MQFERMNDAGLTSPIWQELYKGFAKEEGLGQPGRDPLYDLGLRTGRVHIVSYCETTLLRLTVSTSLYITPPEGVALKVKDERHMQINGGRVVEIVKLSKLAEESLEESLRQELNKLEKDGCHVWAGHHVKLKTKQESRLIVARSEEGTYAKVRQMEKELLGYIREQYCGLPELYARMKELANMLTGQGEGINTTSIDAAVIAKFEEMSRTLGLPLREFPEPLEDN